MPDAQDWYPFRPSSDQEILGDLGELAARLGSQIIYDKRGDILWADSFEYGIGNWTPTTEGANSYVKLIAGDTHHGAYAARLYAAAGTENNAAIHQWFHVPRATKYGLTVSWRAITSFDYLHVYLYYFLGADTKVFHLRINQTNHKLEIESPYGTFVEVGDIGAFYIADCPWYTTKMVVDMDTYKYVRAFFGHVEYDISDYAAGVAASEDSGVMRVTISNWSTESANETIDIDNVILTVNEP